MNTTTTAIATEYETWEYVPLGIVEDLKNVPNIVSSMLPGTGLDDSSLTALLTEFRASQTVEAEYTIEIARAA